MALDELEECVGFGVERKVGVVVTFEDLVALGDFGEGFVVFGDFGDSARLVT